MGSAVLTKVKGETLEALGRETLTLTDGSTVSVGRLSINQSLALVRVAAQAMRDASSADVAEVKAAMEDGEGRTVTSKLEAGWPVILGVLDSSTVSDLISILIDRDADCDALALDDFVDVSAAVVRNNKWSALSGLFTRALRGASSPTSKPSSDQAAS